VTDEFNVNFNARDNVSAIVKKIANNIDTLGNNFSDLVGAIEDLGKAQNSVISGTKNLGQALGDSVEKGAERAQKSIKAITKALQFEGLEGSGNLTFAEVFKGSTREIEEFKRRLSEAGIVFADFARGDRSVAELAQEFQDLTGRVNNLRAALGQQAVSPGDLLNTEEALKEINSLQSQLDVLVEAASTGASLNIDSEEAVKDLENFNKILAEIRSKQAGSQPTFSQTSLVNFQGLRDEANASQQKIAELQRDLIAIGPAAREGEEAAVKSFQKIRAEIVELESGAKDLGRQLGDGLNQFSREVGSRNTTLRDFGFREVTLDDIFPTQEQQKVEDLNRRINAAVITSVEQGAVRDSLNFFLNSNAQLSQVDQNITRLTSQLPRLRYALYDVSTSLTVVGAALTGVAFGAIKVASDFERSFAEVIRTVGLAGDATAIQGLRSELLDLSKEIPASFSDLSNIAKMAGQLSIAEESVASFTGTVAKFAATTDVSTEAAATAFGRLDRLVKGVDGQFEKLASSILAVGVNSVSTEAEVIAIASQLASIANIAGFSADELIGFSSALASVGTRPELARGTFTRLFSEINRAVSSSTENLGRFARLAGQSVDEFREAWTSGRGTDVIIELLRGLSTQGAEAELSLRALGITSVRDIPTLLKLAQSIDEVEKELLTAKVAFLAGTELNEQYAIISETLSERLVVLKNNFQALIATVGNLTGPLKGLVNALISFIGFVEKLARNPISQFFIAFAIAITGVVGVATLLGGVLARVSAGAAGLLTTLISVRTAIGVTQVGIAGLNTTLAGTTVAASGATAAMSGFAVANAGVAGAASAAAGATGIAGVNSAIRSFMGLSAPAAKKATGFGAALFGLFKQSKALPILALGGKLAFIGSALFLVVAAVNAIGKSFGLWGQEVEKVFENTSPYIAALKADTRDWAEATGELKDEFKTFVPALKEGESGLSDYVQMVLLANGEEETLANLIDRTTNSMENQTVAIGENVKALLRQDLVKRMMEDAERGFNFFSVFPGGSLWGVTADNLRQNEAVRDLTKILTDPALREAISGLGFDYGEFVEAVVSGSSEAAVALSEQLAAAAAELADQLEEIDPVGNAEKIDQLRNVARNGAPALQRYNDEFQETIEALTQVTLKSLLTGEGFGTLEDAIEDATNELKVFNDTFNQAFGDVNAIKEINDALIALDSAIENNGTSFDRFTVDGINNLVTLQSALFATITNAQALGLDAAGAIAVVFDQLVRSGVDIATAFSLVTRAGAAFGIEVGSIETLTAAVGRLGFELGTVGKAAKSAGGSVKTFADQARELTSSLFAGINALRSSEEAIFALGEAFGQSGREALFGSSEMQSAINAIIGASDNGEQAVANLSALFIKLTNTVGSQADPSLNILRQTINALAKQFGITTAQVEQFVKTAGGGLANINVDNFSRGIKNAQKEVRTLLDFGRDLQQIFSRAFDIRFARFTALDSLADSWDRVSESIEDARLQVEDLLASQQDLSADRSLKEYFLSIAEAYGDDLRAAQLRKELADLNRQQLKATRDLEKAQQIAGGDLTTQGPGARQNRQALLGLLKNYQDYIVALAESGASQAELTVETERARREFTEQARALGFQESVILQYAAAFDDVAIAIERVPRNITVEANVNPALQALNELNASLNRQIQAANDLNRALNQPVAARTGTGGATPAQPAANDSSAAARKAADEASLRVARAALASWDAEVRRLANATPYNQNAVNFARSQQSIAFQEVRAIEAKLRSYASGGFTGRGGKFEPAGIVHRGEYVIPKQFVNQSTGMPDPSFLAQIKNGMRNYFNGGFVGGGGGMGDGTVMVELSPYDRKLLADAGNVQLRLNGRVVAEATNQNNFEEARRGSN